MSIDTRVNRTELQGVLNKLTLLSKTMTKDVERVINRNALKIESNAKKNLSSIYPIINRDRVDTGVLRSSIKTIKTHQLGREVGTNLEYAPYVEFGTKSRVETEIEGVDYSAYAIQFKKSSGGSGGMYATPYLFPAYEKQRKVIFKEIKRVVDGKR